MKRFDKTEKKERKVEGKKETKKVERKNGGRKERKKERKKEKHIHMALYTRIIFPNRNRIHDAVWCGTEQLNDDQTIPMIG